MHTTLITAAQLYSQLDDVRIIDCRFDLAKPQSGENAYYAGHLPGALYAHLERDLSSPITPLSGRHPLPDAQLLAQTFGRWGIDNTTQVVAYDADNSMFAARLWWLLRWLGHTRVAVLDGGFKAWQRAGLPISTDLPTINTCHFVGMPNDNDVVNATEVMERMQQVNWRIVDARSAERFHGEVEPIDPVAGHIPGAHNHPFALNLNANAEFLSPAELRARYQQTLDNVAANQVIAMCGSGVTACHNLLAMELAGLTGAKLYAGSWSEWLRDPARPVTNTAQSPSVGKSS